MVNLESQNLMHLSDFSVLHEIFLPNSTASIDPKLVLPRAYLPSISQVSPQQRKDPPPVSSPPPVPLSVQELERVDSKAELVGLGDEAEGAPRVNTGSPLLDNKSPPVDIVNLAAEEIRKPLAKAKDDNKGRVAWNLAGLVGHLPDTPGLPHPYPGYPAPHPHAGYSPHLLPQALPPDLPHSYSNFGAAMGVSQPSLVTSMATHTTATPSIGSGNTSVTANPTYKMEPTDPSMYYPGTSGLGEGEHQAAFQPSHHLGGPPATGAELGPSAVMQTLQDYFGQPVDMQQHEDGSSWLGEAGSGLHSGLFPHQDYDYGSYTDRKKKIIREWNKTQSSPRPPETLTSDPLRQSYLPGHELFQHPSTLTYNPYGVGVKDEPLRSEYPYAYGYPELVNPYHHGIGRREKRKKQDSLPGGNTLTRDERKAQAMGLPIPCSEIINLPMDEFNDLLSKHELTEEQLTLCRDIRRRGKNKVAAQNCRKRKIDQIKQLETEVTRIKCRKTELVTDHEKLMQQRATWSDLVKRLHDYVLKELGHDPLHWQLQMDHNRQVHILPRTGGPPIAGPGPLPAGGLQGELGPQDQHHEQAVNMASNPKGSRGYDIGGRGHGGQVPHAPSPLHHQSQIHQNSS